MSDPHGYVNMIKLLRLYFYLRSLIVLRVLLSFFFKKKRGFAAFRICREFRSELASSTRIIGPGTVWQGSTSGSKTGSGRSLAKRGLHAQLRLRSPAKPADWSALALAEPRNRGSIQLRAAPQRQVPALPPGRHAAGGGRRGTARGEEDDRWELAAAEGGRAAAAA